MASQALNFLWLNLDLPAPPDPEDGSIREPLPRKYVESIRRAGKDNPNADVMLWVDSKRLTRRQMEFLKAALEEGRPNVHLKNLRALNKYRHNPLYNERESNANWRNGGKHSLIWRQVDAAKVLISLQGDYDQTFFCDLDYARLPIGGKEIQGMLQKHHFMVGSGDNSCKSSIENQLWGFERSRKPFFESYYEAALQKAAEGENAWGVLCDKVRGELHDKEGIPLPEICFPFANDGSQAEHTGHEWRNGNQKKTAPATIPGKELTRLFNAKSQRRAGAEHGAPAVSVAFNDNAPPYQTNEVMKPDPLAFIKKAFAHFTRQNI
jgi:hypothetical protein